MHCEREREKVRGKILGNRFERTTKGCYNSKVPHGSSVSAVLLRGIPPSESAQCTAKLAVSRRTGSGQVAQVVERSPEKAGVGGSTPSLATIYFVLVINCLALNTNYHHTERTHIEYPSTGQQTNAWTVGAAN